MKSPNLDSIVRIAEEKTADIEERQKALAAMKRQLNEAIRQLRRKTGPVCPAAKPKKTARSNAGKRPY